MHCRSSIQIVVALAAFSRSSAIADEKSPKPGEVREFEIAAGVKMKFCWIPPGEAQLGSPMAEREAVHWFPDIDLITEAENLRGKYKSKGFWLGKFPVTQSEWQAVVGANPSEFSKLGHLNDLVAGLETARFPVDSVSWNDCGKFLNKLNVHGKTEIVFGKHGKFVLPHEDEWEYACRGGMGNRQAFYFGNSLNGTQANCRGADPFGTEQKGPYKKRTTEVGAYEKVSPHPWGLCDMHGNICQWCENWFDRNQEHRVLRGGYWDWPPDGCRAAFRNLRNPDDNADFAGFRVCFRPD